MNFEENFWNLVKDRGRVANFYRNECEALWNNYSPEQQQAICESIEKKLQSGRFVSYRPNEALLDNVPRAPRTQVLSYDEHYRRYQTDVPQDGFKKIFLPDQHKTIYVKQISNLTHYESRSYARHRKYVRKIKIKKPLRQRHDLQNFSPS